MLPSSVGQLPFAFDPFTLKLWLDVGGVRHGGWPVHVSGHRPSLWPMAAREWPTLDIRSGAV